MKAKKMKIKLKKLENLFNLITFEKFETILNAVISVISGSTATKNIFIIPFDKNPTTGLYIDAEAFPPTASIKVSIMGDIISFNFAIVLIVICAFDKSCINKLTNNKIIERIQAKKVISETL